MLNTCRRELLVDYFQDRRRLIGSLIQEIVLRGFEDAARTDVELQPDEAIIDARYAGT
jgi:hypothetical protein